MSIESVMPSNHLILCHPHLLLPSIFPSIKVLSNDLAPLIRWPMYWSFSFSISPFNEYSVLISFTITWFDLAVPGTLKSLLRHHSSKASILQHSAFFFPALTSVHDYWKNHSFDCIVLCQQKCFCFLIHCLGWSLLFFQGVEKSLSCVQLFVTPWTVAYQAPPSTEFSRPKYWSGLPFPSPGHLPDTGIKPMSPAWAEGFFTTESPRKPSKEQVYFNFWAAVTVCSDFGIQENCLSLFPIFPHLFVMKWWDWMSRSLFLTVEF